MPRLSLKARPLTFKGVCVYLLQNKKKYNLISLYLLYVVTSLDI